MFITGFSSSLLLLLKVLNIFPLTSVQVGVHKILQGRVMEF